jgi:hypothetical protein
MNEEKAIPTQIAKLIIGFLQNTLTEEQHLKLDQWLKVSDANLEVFEILCDGNDGNVFDIKELIIDTDDLLDEWMVAGLIARKMEGEISKVEKKFLKGWKGLSKDHKRRYKFLSNKDNLKKFISSLNKQAKRTISKSD